MYMMFNGDQVNLLKLHSHQKNSNKKFNNRINQKDNKMLKAQNQEEL